MYLDTKESKLLNQVIKSVSMPDDEHLVFTLENGSQVNWETYGDCCSETWFENISGIGMLADNKVVEIVEREIPEEVQKALKPYRQVEDQLYGYSLKVEVKYHDDSWNEAIRFEMVDIEFRNSSNGYYGGSIEETFIEAIN